MRLSAHLRHEVIAELLSPTYSHFEMSFARPSSIPLPVIWTEILQYQTTAVSVVQNESMGVLEPRITYVMSMHSLRQIRASRLRLLLL
jgi:hypothetical protein